MCVGWAVSSNNDCFILIWMPYIMLVVQWGYRFRLACVKTERGAVEVYGNCHSSTMYIIQQCRLPSHCTGNAHVKNSNWNTPTSSWIHDPPGRERVVQGWGALMAVVTFIKNSTWTALRCHAVPCSRVVSLRSKFWWYNTSRLSAGSHFYYLVLIIDYWLFLNPYD